MGPDASTFLALVGGFYFVIRCQLLYLISLQLGQAVAVLLSSLFACLFVLASRMVVWLIVLAGCGSKLEAFSHALWPSPYGGSALGAFLLAIFFAEVIAQRLLRTKRVTTWVINNFASELVKLLFSSMLHLKPVSLTLDTRKFYIGFVQEIPSLDPAKAFVRLLPILSGYRDEKDLTFHFTTNYSLALKEATDKEDFVIVIPLSAVKTANLFNQATHSRLFGQPRLSEEGLT